MIALHGTEGSKQKPFQLQRSYVRTPDPGRCHNGMQGLWLHIRQFSHILVVKIWRRVACGWAREEGAVVSGWTQGWGDGRMRYGV